MNTLSLYRRHSDYCREEVTILDRCECPLWIQGIYQAKPIRRSIKTKDLARGKELLTAYRSGVILDKASTVEYALRKYILECELNGVKSSTLRSYMCTLGPLDVFVGKKSLDKLTVDDILAYRSSRPVTASSALKELTHLKSFFKWAKLRNLAPYNLTLGMRGPKSDSKPTLPFTKPEVSAILAACDRTNKPAYARALVLSFLYTGLRISDMTLFSPAKIDGTRAKLRQAKTGEWVTVALPETVLTALDAIKPAVPNAPYFRDLSHTIDASIDSNRKLISRLGDLAGVKDCHPHRFRDTFAVELLLAGTDIRTVQILLGHSSVKTTEEHYAPFVPAFQEKLDTATAKLNF